MLPEFNIKAYFDRVIMDDVWETPKNMNKVTYKSNHRPMTIIIQ